MSGPFAAVHNHKSTKNTKKQPVFFVSLVCFVVHITPLPSTQCLGNRIVSRSEALSIPLTECGSPVGR